MPLAISAQHESMISGNGDWRIHQHSKSNTNSSSLKPIFTVITEEVVKGVSRDTNHLMVQKKTRATEAERALLYLRQEAVAKAQDGIDNPACIHDKAPCLFPGHNSTS